MNNIDVNINGKSYKIGCSEGTAEDIKQYAKELDLRVSNLKNENPTSFLNLSQETLFLFEALSLISELNELKEQRADTYQREIAELSHKVKQLSKTIEGLQKVVE